MSPDQTRTLVEKPFPSEAELEKFIFGNQQVLGGDIFIMYRQIRTGSRQGIPDMLGVDRDSRVCIIELKNDKADESILPQALGYALWAETNPDSIKAIWLESKLRPEGIEIDWDNLDIRIILIAPAFKSTVPRMAGKIGYPVDLMQVRRYSFEKEEMIIIETLEEEPQHKGGSTKAKEEWDWDYYKSEHGEEAVGDFRKTVEAIASFVKKQGWNLPYNLNKYYTGFKLGNRVVFSVQWGGTYSWNLAIRVPENIAKDFKGKFEFQRFEASFNLAIFRPPKLDPSDITELEPLFVEAYKTVSGVR
jgi:hypothetical protein